MLTTEHYPQASFLSSPVLLELEGLQLKKIEGREMQITKPKQWSKRTEYNTRLALICHELRRETTRST